MPHSFTDRANTQTIDASHVNELQLALETLRLGWTYLIVNDGGTYRAYDRGGAQAYSGTGLVADILNAIEAANASGGYHIHFAAGSFDMGTANWTINGDNDITVSGEGIGVTHIFNSSDAAADTEPFSHTNAQRMTYRDFDISAGGTARTSSDCLDFDNCSYCLVERVRVLDSRGRGIVFDGKDTAAAADYNVIRDCIVTNCRGGTNQAGSGILFLAGQNNLVAGNTVFDVTGYGIAMQKGSSTAGQPNKKSSYNRILGNTVINAGISGINIHSSDANLISGNTILNSSDDLAGRDGVEFTFADSITADDNVITGNLITDNQGTKTQDYAVNIASADANRTIVVANNLRGNVQTASINDAGTGTVSANNVTG